MIIENMRFAQLPDGRTEVKFLCRDCQRFVDKPSKYSAKTSIFTTYFLCPECIDRAIKKSKTEEETRKKQMTVWQKFIEFWK